MSKVTFIWVKTLSSNSRLIFCTFSRVQSCCFVVVVFFFYNFSVHFYYFYVLERSIRCACSENFILVSTFHAMASYGWYGMVDMYCHCCQSFSLRYLSVLSVFLPLWISVFVFELTQNFRFLSVRRALCFIECTFVRKTPRTHNSYTLPIFVLRFIGFPSFWRSSGLPCYDNLNEAHRGIHIFSIRKTLYI